MLLFGGGRRERGNGKREKRGRRKGGGKGEKKEGRGLPPNVNLK